LLYIVIRARQYNNTIEKLDSLIHVYNVFTA